MNAMLGSVSVTLAWVLSMALFVCCIVGRNFKSPSFAALARPLAWVQILLVWTSLAFLINGFIQKDFHMVYVAQHAAESLPLVYRIAATWGGHEGSLLLWISLLQAWLAVYCCRYTSYHPAYFNLSLSVFALISAAFLSILVISSSPFGSSVDVLQGKDLNPLLQDPGLVTHPPFLYMGYVGFAVFFGFTMSALWEERVDRAWAKQVRPWLMFAWGCLTVGITLGSLWAYRELGWGGYWFWDPVENAALMPWCVGTALIHMLLLLEKQDKGQAWVVALAILAFGLSILGTFLVRSGVVVSVHSFTPDPTRGLMLLSFLAFFLVGAFIIYAVKVPRLAEPVTLSIGSSGWYMWLNSLSMLFILFVVMLGTLYPMVTAVLGLEEVSIGAPYFEAVLGPFGVAMLFLMGRPVLPSSPWKRFMVLIGSMLVVYIFLMLMHTHVVLSAWLGVSVALWAAITWCSARNRAALIAHVGVAVLAVGVIFSSTYADQKEVILKTGEHVRFGRIEVWFESTYGLNGPNYRGVAGVFRIYEGGQLTDRVTAEKRIYTVSNMVMTDAGISAGVFRDVYVALGQPEQADTWSVRVYVKPFVRWVWLAGALMVIGGLSVLARRRA